MKEEQEDARGHGDRSPFDDAELYDILFSDLRYDLDFYRGLAKESKGPVLEVGCGTGRVLLACLKEGVDIDGIDSSPHMLEVLRKNARAFRLRPRVLKADMRGFHTNRRYHLIIIPFNAFLHNLTTDDQLATLGACRDHLVQEGSLVLNIFFPGMDVLAGPEGEPVLEHEAPHPATGLPVRLYDTRYFDRIGQIQRSCIEIQELDAEGAVSASHRSETAIRWIYRAEMELLLRVAGFPRWKIYGGFDRRELTRETQEMVVFGWPRRR